MSRIIRSPEKQIQHKKKMRLLSIVTFLCIGVFAWLIVYIPSIPSLQIKSIVVEGNKVLTKEEVGKFTEAALSGKYFYLFPKTNIFIYPKEAVLAEVLASFPRIADAKADLDTERILIVSVIEREPFALWCGFGVPEAGSSGDCFYLDDRGFVFSPAPHFSGNAYLEFYGAGMLPVGNPVGHNFLPGEIYQNIIKVKERLESFRLKPITVFVAEDGGVILTDSGGYAIRFNADQDVASLESNMQAVFRSSSWKNVVLSGKLEYLDFRFGNKVYYKYKNQEAGVANQE